jgi:hypothetical protein
MVSGPRGQRILTQFVIDAVTNLALDETGWFTATDVRPPGVPTTTVIHVLTRFVAKGDLTRRIDPGFQSTVRYKWVNT